LLRPSKDVALSNGQFSVPVSTSASASTFCDFRGHGAYTLVAYTDSALPGDLTSTRGSFNSSSRAGSASLADLRPIVRGSTGLAITMSTSSSNKNAVAAAGSVADYSRAFHLSVPSPQGQSLARAASNDDCSSATFATTYVDCLPGADSAHCSSDVLPQRMKTGAASMTIVGGSAYGAVERVTATNSKCDVPQSSTSGYAMISMRADGSSSSKSGLAAVGNSGSTTDAQSTALWAYSPPRQVSCSAALKAVRNNDMLAWFSLSSRRSGDGKFVDLSGNGMDLTPSNMTRSSSATVGGIKFDGTGSFATSTGNADALRGDPVFTACAWVRWEASSWGTDLAPIATIASTSTVRTNQGFQFFVVGGRPGVGFTDSRVITQDVVLNTFQWHHVCAAKVAKGTKLANIRIWVDGSLVSSTKADSDPLVSGSPDEDAAPSIIPAPLTIGMHTNRATALSTYWNGFIRDVRVYTRALSAKEIMSVLAFDGVSPSTMSAAASAEQQLVSEWDFDTTGATGSASEVTAMGLRDTVGSHHCSAFGSAKLSDGGLVLDGSGHVKCGALGMSLTSWTLEVTVQLSNLDQRGGGAMSLSDGKVDSVFDSIVFGEQRTGEWHDGSEYSYRASNVIKPLEDSTPTDSIHMVLTTASSGARALYRNGVPIVTQTMSSSAATYTALSSYVLFGCRQEDCASTGTLTVRRLSGRILHARLYQASLSASQVLALYHTVTKPFAKMQPQMRSGARPLVLPTGASAGVASMTQCDMDVMGGGWTRWWWWSKSISSWPSSERNVLGYAFGTCSPTAAYCFGRMPGNIPEARAQLMARDGTGTTYVWDFDPNNPVAHAAWGAFTKGDTTNPQVITGNDVWNPQVIGGAFHGRDQKRFMFRDEKGVRSFLLDDDECSCFSTLEVGHPLCGASSDPNKVPNLLGVDILNGEGCTGPNTGRSLELFVRERPSAAPAVVSFERPVVFVLESEPVARIPLVRTGSLDSAVAVSYKTAGGTATKDVHFVSRQGRVTWAAGEGGSKSIIVPLLSASGLDVSDKSFSVNLVAPEECQVPSTSVSVTVTIRSDRVTSSGTPGPVSFKEEGGEYDSGLNIALAKMGATAFSSGADSSSGVWFKTASLNDGEYGQLQSFKPNPAAPLAGAGATSPGRVPFVGVKFATRSLINHVAFGRDNTGVYVNHWRGQVVIQVTDIPSASANTLEADWTTVDTVTMAGPKRRLYVFNSPVEVFALRLKLLNSTAEPIIIDELEVYKAGDVPRLTTGLLAQYDFSAPTVTNPSVVIDTSGNSRDASVFGTKVSFDSQSSLPSVMFPVGSRSADGYMTIPSLKNFDWGTEFAASVLVKRTGTFAGYAGVIGNGDGTSGSWEIRMTPIAGGTEVGVSVNTVGGTGGGSLILRGKASPASHWHHIVLSHGNNATSLWIDGVQLLRQVSGRVVKVDQPVYIGVSGTPVRPSGISVNDPDPPSMTQGLDGYIHDVRVYNRSLNAVDVAELWKRYDRIITREGMVAWWRMAESSGTTVVDDSGSSPTMTADLSGGATWNDGGLKLDGSSGAGTSISTASKLTGDTPFSICAWVYPDVTSYPEMMDVAGMKDPSPDGVSSFYLALREGYPTLEFGETVYAVEAIPSPLTMKRWTHVCFSKKAGTKEGKVSLFIDGVSKMTKIEYSAFAITGPDANKAPSLKPSKLFVGSQGSTNYFQGVVSDVRILNVALTDTFIAGAFNSGKYLTWSMSEGQGETVKSGSIGVLGSISGPSWKWDSRFLTFAGRGDKVQTQGSSAGFFGDVVGSVCAWVFYSKESWPTVTTSGSNGVVSIGGIDATLTTAGQSGSATTASSASVVNTGFVLSLVAGRPAVDFGGGVFFVADSASAIIPRRWSHLCMTKQPGSKSTTTKLYVDGVVVSASLVDMSTSGMSSTLLNAAPNVRSGPFTLGTVGSMTAYSETMRPPFVGVINDVRVYRRAVTASDVASLDFETKFSHIRDYAVSLEGSGEYASIPPFLWGGGDITVEMWAFCSDAAKETQTLFDFATSTTDKRITAYISPTYPHKLRVEIRNSATDQVSVLETPTGFTEGRWLHVAFMQSGTEGTIYLDGVPARSGAMPKISSGVRAKMLIGKSVGSQKFTFIGKIDDLRIWSKARSASEINAGIKAFPFPTRTQADDMKLDVFIPFDIVHQSPHHDSILQKGGNPSKDQSGHSRDASIVCDDSVAASGAGGPVIQLSRTCVVASPRSATRSLCNNGFREVGEECDDGNTASGDGCSSSCMIESGWVCEHEDFSAADVCVQGSVLAMDTFEDAGNPPGMPSQPSWSPSRGSSGTWTVGSEYAAQGSRGLRIYQRDVTSTGQWVTFGQTVVSGIRIGTFLKLRFNVRSNDFTGKAAPLIVQLVEGTQNPSPMTCLTASGCGSSLVYSVCVNPGSVDGCDEVLPVTSQQWEQIVLDITHKFTSKFGASKAPSSVRIRLIGFADDTETDVWVDDFRIIQLANVNTCGRIAASSSGSLAANAVKPSKFIRFPLFSSSPADNVLMNWQTQFTDFPESEFTIAFWWKTKGYYHSDSSGRTYCSLFQYRTSSQFYAIWLYAYRDDFYLMINGNTYYFYNLFQSNSLTTEATWEHFAITYQEVDTGCNGRLTVYRNGASFGTSCTSRGKIQKNGDFMLHGRYWTTSNDQNDDYYFDHNGPSIGDFGIFGKALSATDITLLAGQPLTAGSAAKPVAIWNGDGMIPDTDGALKSWNDTVGGRQFKPTLGLTDKVEIVDAFHSKDGSLPDPPRFGGKSAGSTRYTRFIRYPASKTSNLGTAVCYIPSGGANGRVIVPQYRAQHLVFWLRMGYHSESARTWEQSLYNMYGYYYSTSQYFAFKLSGSVAGYMYQDGYSMYIPSFWPNDPEWHMYTFEYAKESQCSGRWSMIFTRDQPGSSYYYRSVGCTGSSFPYLYGYSYSDLVFGRYLSRYYYYNYYSSYDYLYADIAHIAMYWSTSANSWTSAEVAEVFDLREPPQTVGDSTLAHNWGVYDSDVFSNLGSIYGTTNTISYLRSKQSSSSSYYLYCTTGSTSYQAIPYLYDESADAAAAVPRPVGGSFAFWDIANDQGLSYLKSPSASSVTNWPAGDLTVSIWLRASPGTAQGSGSATYGTVLSFATASTVPAFSLRIGKGTTDPLTVAIGSTVLSLSAVTNDKLSTGYWTHLVVTRAVTSGLVTVYVERNATATGTLAAGTSPNGGGGAGCLVVGAMQSGSVCAGMSQASGFRGGVAQLSVWSRVLSASEVKDLWSSAPSVFQDGLQIAHLAGFKDRWADVREATYGYPSLVPAGTSAPSWVEGSTVHELTSCSAYSTAQNFNRYGSFTTVQGNLVQLGGYPYIAVVEFPSGTLDNQYTISSYSISGYTTYSPLESKFKDAPAGALIMVFCNYYGCRLGGTASNNDIFKAFQLIGAQRFPSYYNPYMLLGRKGDANPLFEAEGPTYDSCVRGKIGNFSNIFTNMTVERVDGNVTQASLKQPGLNLAFVDEVKRRVLSQGTFDLKVSGVQGQAGIRRFLNEAPPNSVLVGTAGSPLNGELSPETKKALTTQFGVTIPQQLSPGISWAFVGLANATAGSMPGSSSLSSRVSFQTRMACMLQRDLMVTPENLKLSGAVVGLPLAMQPEARAYGFLLSRELRCGNSSEAAVAFDVDSGSGSLVLRQPRNLDAATCSQHTLFVGSFAQRKVSPWQTMTAFGSTNQVFWEYSHGTGGDPAMMELFAELRCKSSSNTGYLFKPHSGPITTDYMARYSIIGSATEAYGGFFVYWSETISRVYFPSATYLSSSSSYDYVRGAACVIPTSYGGGKNTMPRDPTGDVRIRVSKLQGTPAFDSGWGTMRSQDTTASYRVLKHGLGGYPDRVRVLVKPDTTSANAVGMHTECDRSAQSTDENPSQWAGCVYAFDSENIFIWFPRWNDRYSSGAAWSSYYWGNSQYAFAFSQVLVRAQAWSGLRKADFESDWMRMVAGDATSTMSYREVSHNLASLPERVDVIVRAPSSQSPTGLAYFGTVGMYAGHGLFDAGIIQGHNEQTVRLWAPTKLGRAAFVKDGWGAEQFTVEAGTVDVKVRVWRLNYESEHSVGLVLMNIQEINSPPKASSMKISVAEDAVDGSVLGTYSAVDPDAMSFLTYRIIGGDAEETFAINQATGQISVRRASTLNFGKQRRYLLLVEVSDGALVDVGVLTVDVVNRNSAPRLYSAEFEVFEDSPYGTPVTGGAMKAVDDDSEDTLLFEIVSGNIGDAFRIGGCSGELRVNEPLVLDYEARTSILLTISVTDDGYPPLNDTALALVHIKDVNEPPSCSPMTRSLFENEAAHSPLGTKMVATDPEGHTITWQIEFGDEAGVFYVDSQGYVRVQAADKVRIPGSKVNYEARSSYTLGVKATDNGVPPLSCSTTLTVTVKDSNDPPVPPSPSPVLFIQENSEPGVIVNRFSLVDEDTMQPGSNDSVTISILPSSAGYTQLTITHDPTTQEAVLRATSVNLDFESTPQFIVTYRATDLGGNERISPRSFTANFTVKLINVNDPPVFIQPLEAIEFTVGENAVPGTPLKVWSGSESAAPGPAVPVAAIDPEGDSYTFSVDAFCTKSAADISVGQPGRCDISSSLGEQNRNPSAPRPPFTVHPTTGHVTIRNSTILNYEKDKEVMLYVRARDNGSPPVSSYKTILVHLLNENDPPLIKCAEGTEGNRTAALGKFTINGKMWPVCRTIKLPEVYALNTVTGLTLGLFDEDLHQGTFEIMQGAITSALPTGMIDGSSWFEVKNTAGQVGNVVLKVDGKLDFETNPRVAFFVRVLDKPTETGWVANYSDPALVVIELQDVDEPPQWRLDADGNVRRFVAQGFPTGTAVGRALPAFDPEGAKVTFKLVGGRTDLFRVDPATGQLFLTQTISTSEPTKIDAYSLSVEVSDGVLKSTFSGIRIDVVPLNNPPIVSNQAASVVENSPVGTSIGAPLTANPGDVGQSVSFEIDRSWPEWGVKGIQVSSSGQLSVKSSILDYENTTTIILRLYAIDNDPAAPASTPFNVTVTVTNADDMPECVGAGLSSPEVIALGLNVSVGNVYCADQDNDTFSVRFNSALSKAFHFGAGQPAPQAANLLRGWIRDFSNSTMHASEISAAEAFLYKYADSQIVSFSVSSTSGVSAFLNYEDMTAVPLRTYQLAIERLDAKVRSANVLLHVTDVNEPPIIVSHGFSVLENATMGTVVGKVQAYDEDVGDEFTIRVDTTDGQSLFRYEANSTSLLVNGELDYEREWQFNITIVAEETTASRLPQDRLSSRASVPVTLMDVNDLVVTGVSGSMPFDTRGGSQLVLTGRNFGFRSQIPPMNVEVRFGPASDPLRFQATACSVTTENTEISCTMPEGAGAGMRVWVKVSSPNGPNGVYVQSGWGTAGVVIDYAPPAVSSVQRVAAMLYTDGGDEFDIVGNMFGPVGTNVSATYGKDVTSGGASGGADDVATYQFQASNCRVVAAHTRIRCRAAQGVGAGFALRTNVAGQTSQSLQNALSYDVPTVTSVELYSSASVTPPKLLSMNTRGGEFMVLRGRNLGYFAAGGIPGGARSATTEKCSAAGMPGLCSEVLNDFDSDPSNDKTMFPFSVAVWYGFPSPPRNAAADAMRPPAEVAAEVAAEEKQRRLFRPVCTVLTPHHALLCRSVAGYGGSLAVTVLVANQESASNDTVARTMYSTPSIVAVTGDGSFNALTRGNQDVFLAGQFFGTTEHNAVKAVMYGPTGTEYQATSCIVTADHIQVTCRTAPGVGRSLRWRVLIGNQWSTLAGNTSYAPPVISYFSGPGAISALTVGGQDVFVRGENFGFEDSKIDFVNYRIVGFDREVRFEAANCFIVEPHSMLKCQTVPGAGKILEWMVSVASQPSVDPVTGYGRPVVETVSSSGEVNTQALSTDGGQRVELTGANLGPLNQPGPFLDWIRYGPTGGEYLAKNCSLLGTGHTKLQCWTVPGVGSGPHYWKVSVAGFVSEISSVGPGTTQFAPPTISMVVPAAGYGSPLATSGGQLVTVIGTNLGFRDPSTSIVLEMVLTGAQGSRTLTVVPTTPTYTAGRDIALFLTNTTQGRALIDPAFDGEFDVIAGKGWASKVGKPGHKSGYSLQILQFVMPEGFGANIKVQAVITTTAPLDASAPGASGNPVVIRSGVATVSYAPPAILYVNPRFATAPEWKGWYQLDIIGVNLCNSDLGCIIVGVSENPVSSEFGVRGAVNNVTVGDIAMVASRSHDRVTVYVLNKQGAVRIYVGNQRTDVKSFSRLAPALGLEQPYATSGQAFSSGGGSLITLKGCNWVPAETRVEVGGYVCQIQSFIEPTDPSDDPGCSRAESQATIKCLLPAGVGRENAVSVIIQSADGDLSSDGRGGPTPTPAARVLAAVVSSIEVEEGSGIELVRNPTPRALAMPMSSFMSAGIPSESEHGRQLAASPSPFPRSVVIPAPTLEPSPYPGGTIPNAPVCVSQCLAYSPPKVTAIRMRNGIVSDRPSSGNGEETLVANIVDGTSTVSVTLPTHPCELIFEGSNFGTRGEIVLRPRLGSTLLPMRVYPIAGTEWTQTRIVARLPGSEGQSWTVEVWQGLGLADASRNPQKQVSPVTISLNYQYPQIVSASPTLVKTLGGDVVTFVGRNFGVNGPELRIRSPGSTGWSECPITTRVVFDPNSPNNWDFSHTHVRCAMPEGQGAASGVELQVRVDGRDVPVPFKGVIGYLPPVLQSVTPPMAPSEGGTTIVIRGSNLGVSGELNIEWVTEGNVPLKANFTILSHNHTTVVARVSAGFGVNRRLSLSASGQSNAAQSTPLYWSYSAARIDSISPMNGPTVPDRRKGDETLLTVRGSSFGVRGGTITIDGYDCRITTYSHTMLQCLIPPGMFANRVVRFRGDTSVPTGVANSALYFDGRWSTTNATFSYDPPIVTGVDPSRPNAEGEPRLVIYGRNFGPFPSDAFVHIGAQECANATRASDEMISCSLGRDVVGRKNLTVTVASQTSFFSEDDFRVRVTLICKSGYYGGSGESCLKCPVGALCERDEIVDPVSIPGFWRFHLPNGVPNKTAVVEKANGVSVDPSSLWIYTPGGNPSCPAGRRSSRPECSVYLPCQPSEACIGDNKCATGYTSDRCSICSKGFYRLDGLCERCPENPALVLIGFIVIAIVAVIGAYLLQRSHVNLTIGIIGVDFFQVLAIFARSRINWPEPLRVLFRILSAFNLNIELAAPECLIESFGAVERFAGTLLIPCIAAMIFFLLYIGKLLYKVCIKKVQKEARNAHLPTMVAAFISMFYFLYLFLSRQIFEVFNCSPTDPPDGKTYLSMVFEECGKPGGVQETLMPWAVIALLVYVIGFPIGAGVILWRNKDSFKKDQLLYLATYPLGHDGYERAARELKVYRLRKMYSRLYQWYTPGKLYWVELILARKFLIAISTLLFRQTPTFQFAMMLLVLFVSYALHVKNVPYLSIADRETILTKWRDDKDSAKHEDIKRIVNNVVKKPTTRRMSVDWEKPRNVAIRGVMEVQKYIFNYNTVEGVLLFVAVLTCLTGIMLNSQRFESSYYDTQRDTITGLIITILSGAIIYVFAVITFEIIIVLRPDMCSGKPRSGGKSGKTTKGSKASTVPKGPSSDVALVNEPEAASLSIMANPMHDDAGTRDGFTADEVRTLRAGTVSQEQIDSVARAYESLLDRYKEVEKQLRDIELSGGAMTPGDDPGKSPGLKGHSNSRKRLSMASEKGVSSVLRNDFEPTMSTGGGLTGASTGSPASRGSSGGPAKPLGGGLFLGAGARRNRSRSNLLKSPGSQTGEGMKGMTSPLHQGASAPPPPPPPPSSPAGRSASSGSSRRR
jgi:cysteine-rich repeat protein